ncbi:hypothetical protein MW887_006336 [Aspergillus wentii]|nr:hypothetical protein MW887_006336 [Aspergillus wentii]
MTSPEAWRNVLIVVPLLGAALATVFFFLRVYSRRVSGVGLKTEDFLAGIGLVASYGVTVCVIVAAFQGVGKSIWSLPNEQGGRITFVFWLAQTFWPISQLFVKTAITTLLRRLLGSVNRYRTLTTALVVFTVVWCVAAIIGNIIQCIPPQYFWDKTIPGGHCMSGQSAFFMAIGAISLFEDVVLLCLPLPMVWRLQMVRREKAQITVLFLMGSLACVFSLLRLVEFHNYGTNKISDHGALESIWTLLELNFATICGSLVLMKPIYQRCMSSLRRYSRYSSSSGKKSFSSRSSEYDGIFRPWAFGTTTSHHTEVRAHAFPTPSCEQEESVDLSVRLPSVDVRMESVSSQSIR